MVVKEYCLIPKSKVDKHDYFKNLPPTAPHKALDKIDAVTLSKPEHDSTVDDLMKMTLKPSDYDYGKGILSFLRKKPLVKWDREGQITYPVRDINIIDAIKYFVTKNSTFDTNKIADLRLVVRLGGVPESFIKNMRARHKLFDNHKGGAKKQKRKIMWEPY